MSKTSHCQRVDSLQLWMKTTLKVKSRDAAIFCDPSKRVAKTPVHTPSINLEDIDILPDLPSNKTIPRRKER